MLSTDALRKALAALDALADEIADEDFDDLNAELEDAILMLEDGDDDPEAAETFAALGEGYMKWPEAREIGRRIRDEMGAGAGSSPHGE